ncbi:MAG: hypothetical protein HN764_08045 [Gammaproteobacteria bacterium]|jgi:uncharacterized protein YjiK|nr:hypothetical protein [Gammaproteobacteria bacterium]
MQHTRILGPKALAQFVVALALLITFSTGLMVGRHVSSETRTGQANTASGPYFPYELDQAIRKIELPEILREASAISYIDRGRIGVVQDELGTIFICSIIDGRIINQISFASGGDFEGLAILNDEAWVLRSDGDLFHVKGLGDANPLTIKVETPLDKKDDTEGLTYDAIEKQLLIGLKAPPKLKGKRHKGMRAVYSYKLDRKFMSESPFLLLNMDEIKRVYSNQVVGNKSEKFKLKMKKDFRPSDLAIHPITGHIYHIAARGQLLVVSDRSGQIYYVRDLPKLMFRQPEGISFDPRGNMFIVSEGVDSKAMLFEFKYQPVARKVEAEAQTSSFSLL